MKLYENKDNKYVNKYQEIDITNLTSDEIICTYAFQLAILNNAEYDNFICCYNLGNYGEQMVNIYKDKESWEVSIGERRNAFERRTFSNCVLAYMYALELLADEKEQLKNLLLDFSRYLMKDYTIEQLGNFERLHILSEEDTKLLLKDNDTIKSHYDKVRIIKRRILQKYQK